MTRLQIEQLGPIAKADITLGELTVFVGPQASGKSIALETFKLALDRPRIIRTLKERGYVWKDQGDFLQLYYGEGMGGLWNETTSVKLNGKEISPTGPSSKRKDIEERVFFIPAQRVLILSDGWPRGFRDYDPGDPYVVQQFSEHIRQLVNTRLGSGRTPIFPQRGRLAAPLRDLIDNSIFHGLKLRRAEQWLRKRLVLDMGGETYLAFMAWSTGQREFVPLLLGLYYLLPSGSISKRKDIRWVIVEEPEMGLHAQAITTLMVSLLELIQRGYRVVISTHATQVLEILWGLRHLQEARADVSFFRMLFGLKGGPFADKLWAKLRKATLNTYYFEHTAHGVVVKDISTLDPYDEDDAVADWGGLTELSTRASEVVSRVVIEGEA